MTRTRTPRALLRKRGPYHYADLRRYGRFGGGYEAMIPPGERFATTDPDVAMRLLADRVAELDLK